MASVEYVDGHFLGTDEPHIPRPVRADLTPVKGVTVVTTGIVAL